MRKGFVLHDKYIVEMVEDGETIVTITNRQTKQRYILAGKKRKEVLRKTQNFINSQILEG